MKKTKQNKNKNKMAYPNERETQTFPTKPQLLPIYPLELNDTQLSKLLKRKHTHTNKTTLEEK